MKIVQFIIAIIIGIIIGVIISVFIDRSNEEENIVGNPKNDSINILLQKNSIIITELNRNIKLYQDTLEEMDRKAHKNRKIYESNMLRLDTISMDEHYSIFAAETDSSR
ncbi:MAG: hypothetical protein RBT65_12095 [Methanolobus sp.]|jgi:uncharacterized protein YneF (UPF0154 family)|nr:hypothetical protein [Bacteroidales bacterium]MDY0387839.1 hypothetical protein [Methanolobus sp.]